MNRLRLRIVSVLLVVIIATTIHGEWLRALADKGYYHVLLAFTFAFGAMFRINRDIALEVPKAWMVSFVGIPVAFLAAELSISYAYDDSVFEPFIRSIIVFISSGLFTKSLWALMHTYKTEASQKKEEHGPPRR